MSSSIQQFSASGITARLFELISDMSETEKKELFVLIGDQRKYVRSPYLMQVTCKTKDHEFTDFILDISPGGIFLETMVEVFVGMRLEITLKFKHHEEPVIVTGNVVWLGRNGAGIQFLFESEEQKELIKKLVDQLA